jgi:hypothetical protein
MDLAKLIEVVKAHPDRDRRSDALYELMIISGERVQFRFDCWQIFLEQNKQ